MNVPIGVVGPALMTVAIIGLIAWIAFLVACVVIVKMTKGSAGLKGFAVAIRAFRRRWK